MGEKGDSEEVRDTPEKSPPDVGATMELRILRQDAVERPASKRWEVFSVPMSANMTLADALRAVQRSPKTTDGRKVLPIAFDYECEQGICGACSVLVEGRVTRSCTAKLIELSPRGKRLEIAPLKKFPLVRDLIVDRSSVDRTLQSVASEWCPNGADQIQSSARSPESQQRLYALTRCTGCGACLEACPQYGAHSDFVGPQVLSSAESLEQMPLAEVGRSERLDFVMSPGGIDDCGKAENCVEVCPVGVPVTDSLGRLSRIATARWLRGWFLG